MLSLMPYLGLCELWLKNCAIIQCENLVARQLFIVFILPSLVETGYSDVLNNVNCECSFHKW